MEESIGGDFAADFASAVPGNRLRAPGSAMVAFLLVVNLVEGTWAMWLYRE